MDFLNKSIAQVSELFRSMTPGARLMAGLLLAVVVVSMGYLFRQNAAGPDAYLFGGAALSDGQLTRIEGAIAKAGLNDYEREGSRIRVPSGQQAKYVAAVADAGALPPNFDTILEDAIGKGGPWESSEQRRERMKVARQQTLSEIIRAMYWVENAVVLYDEHQTRDLHSLMPVKQATASVSVKPLVGESLTPDRAKNIQRLVAHSVNMNASDVAITNLGDGGPTGGSESEISPDFFDDEYMKVKVAFETQKRTSILNLLRDIPGVSVAVNADFDPTIEETTHNVKPDQKTATQRETTRDETSTQTTADGGGRPGQTAQGPNRTGTTESSQKQNQSQTTNKTSETENVVGMEDNRTRKHGYTLKEVWATVKVPGVYVKNVWASQNPTATAPPKPDDLNRLWPTIKERIEEMVDPLLYLQAIKAGNTYKHVRVVMLDSLPAPTIEPPSIAAKAMTWAGHYWSTVAMLGVATFSLLVLRSVVNGKPGDPVAAAALSSPITLEADKPKAEPSSTETEEDGRPRLRLKKGKSLKDDLVEVVREDPDAAADILRSWIAKAG